MAIDSLKASLVLLLTLLLLGCEEGIWNSPYPSEDAAKNILYGAFAEQPRHLDPARAYSSDEYQFIAQIYEPPLQYHYLKRPYTLVPLTATKTPVPRYYNQQDELLPENSAAQEVAYSEYDIEIQPNIYYQPHPAFAKKNGHYRYHDNPDALANKTELVDFEQSDTRELDAEDYVYQIKRLAHPALHSPILGIMAQQIEGLAELSEVLQKDYLADDFDLSNYSISGVYALDKYRYRIRIKGKDPQFIYWLAMPFFSPMAWEVEKFYQQKILLDKNLTLDWYPVGTGPYFLSVNNPNREMILEKNPNYHGENYPTSGSEQDNAQGLLTDAGQPMPFIDQVIFSLEKESIPRWSKFLQGYYDRSGIASDNFDQAIHLGGGGASTLSAALQAKDIHLQKSVGATSFYWGFNMLDETVGGDSERARLLRQALSIALDIEEYIAIFQNGRGFAADGPVPPGIFGYQQGQKGMNPVVYQWHHQEKKRKSLKAAKALLLQAGYQDGREIKTGKPLILNYDVIARGGPDDKARLAWMVKQFNKVDIQLNIRSSQYNRFREKMKNGQAQIFSWGWNADYPDPENFLFLLYGLNGKSVYGGENAANYQNKEFDRLYELMKDMENGTKRLSVINKMLHIAQEDSPWIWGFHPMNYSLSHQWNRVAKPSQMANNTLKYQRLQPSLRAEKRQQWNKPLLWPLGLALLLLLMSSTPIVVSYYNKEHKSHKRRLKLPLRE